MPPPMMASLILSGDEELVDSPLGTGKVTGSSGTDATAEIPLGIGEADDVPFRTVAPFAVPFGTESPFGSEVPFGIEEPFATEAASPFSTGAAFATDPTSGTETTSCTEATSGAEAIMECNTFQILLKKRPKQKVQGRKKASLRSALCLILNPYQVLGLKYISHSSK